MGKSVLVLTGSPRKGGNSDAMAEAFIARAKENGHTVQKVETAFAKIAPCRSCDTCWRTGFACSFGDGFRELEPLLESFDVLVLCSPVYWYGVSAQLKCAIDRMYPYSREVVPRPVAIRESALMICGADDDADGFEGAILSYRGIAKYMKWRDLGVLAVPSVADKGDIQKTDALQRAAALADAL